MFVWDEAKRQANLDKHGVDFAAADGIDWDRTVTVEDLRHDYGERRLLSVGPIAGRLHVLIWTLRDGGPRIISARRANARERRRWENETTPPKTGR